MQHVHRHPLSSICILILFSFMLIFPRQVFLGAKSGLLLWFQTIIPTLLPFSIISNIMIKTGSFYYISNAVGPLFRPFFCVSSAGVFAVIVGFICGYPLGAKVISQLLANQSISKEEADYLLSFCNNVSPIFIINYLVMSALGDSRLILPVLCILIGSPVLCSFFFRFFRKNKFEKSDCHTDSKIQITSFHMQTLNACLMDSFEMMVYLGGYIMIFSVIISLMQTFRFVELIRYLLPFLEVTNGISLLQTYSIPYEGTLIFTLAITSFGGICALFQTKMVLAGSGLSLRKYTIKKLATMLVTSLLTILYLFFI
ncbi:MAG: nucleoside recognition domain-containing protein [Hespellia sp.]|nr:nucleoside recognition domain-containing protein [Hespellia sp.]